MTKKLSNSKKTRRDEIVNSALSHFVSSLDQTNLNRTYQIAQLDSLNLNLRRNSISYNRELLGQSYAEIGIIQKFIDTPVDDSLRGKTEIGSSIISPDQLMELETYMQSNNVMNDIGYTIKWGLLYGGSGLIILTDQQQDKPLNLDIINENSRISFKPADLWELWPERAYRAGDLDINKSDNFNDSEYFYYYGQRIHRSRVIIFKGKEAPSLVKQRLRGWGFSELERVIMPINQYLKANNAIFELLDEAKIDVYKIKGFYSGISKEGGEADLLKGLDASNRAKNYLNALVLDSEDDFQQKQFNFNHIAEILNQIRINIAADLNRPMTKLFGISPAGLNNSGENDIENYNSMVESDIRSKVKYMILGVAEIISKKLFGFIPEDLTVSFEPLRVMSAEQIENVKDKKFNRIERARQLGLMTNKSAQEAINKGELMDVQVDLTDEPDEVNFSIPQSQTE